MIMMNRENSPFLHPSSITELTSFLRILLLQMREKLKLYLLYEVAPFHFVPRDLGGSCDTKKEHFYLHKLQTC